MSDNSRSEFWKGFWSLTSNEESIRLGQVRFWAILETVVAIGVFWYLALRFETLWILYSSMAIAPLLFLRSEEAVKQGARWFDEGMLNSVKIDAYRYNMYKLFFIAVCNIAVFSVFYYFELFENFKSNFYFSLAIIYGCIAYSADMIRPYLYEVTLEKLMEKGIRSKIFAAFALLAIGNIFYMILSGSYFIFYGYFIVCIAYGLAQCISSIIIGFDSSKSLYFSKIDLAISAYFYETLCKIFANLKFFKRGYEAVPKNIENLILRSTFIRKPEILPGLLPDHEAQANEYFVKMHTNIFHGKTREQKVDGILMLIVMPILFAPGILYRFFLKSTLWFWWILYFIGGAPRVDGGATGLKKDILDKRYSRHKHFVAIFCAVIFLSANVFKPFVINQLSGTPFLPVIAAVFVVDWQSIPFLPILAGLSSTLGIVTWYWADSIARDSELPARQARVGRHLQWIAHLIQWKFALSLLFLALTMTYIALYANVRWGIFPVSDWAFGWLSFLYGEYAAVLRPPKL